MRKLEIENISASPFDDYAIKDFIKKNGVKDVCDCVTFPFFGQH